MISRFEAMISSGTRAKGMPKERTTCEPTSASVGLTPIARITQRRREGDRAAQEERDLAVDEALHDDLAGHRPDRGGGEAGGEQGDAEDRRGALRVDAACSPSKAPSIVSIAGQAAAVEERRGDDHHRQVDQPGHRQGDHHVDFLEAQDAAALVVVAADDPVLGQRRVQVDDVRHHRRADDAGRQQDAFGAAEFGDEEVAGDFAAVRARR